MQNWWFKILLHVKFHKCAWKFAFYLQPDFYKKAFIGKKNHKPAVAATAACLLGFLLNTRVCVMTKWHDCLFLFLHEHWKMSSFQWWWSPNIFLNWLDDNTQTYFTIGNLPKDILDVRFIRVYLKFFKQYNYISLWFPFQYVDKSFI